jgi:CheY-like chemotaxis protein
VLLVDDSISVRRIAARHLQTLGLEVDEASDGVEALRKLQVRPYRLVLTDLEMPRMDGFELLAELQRLGNSANLPVVVTSTRGDAETRRRVKELGARAFVAKPVSAADLIGVIGPLVNVAGTPRPAAPAPAFWDQSEFPRELELPWKTR